MQPKPRRSRAKPSATDEEPTSNNGSPLRASWKTGEYWQPVLTKILGALILGGGASYGAYSENLSMAIASAIAGALALIAGAAEGWKVISGRTELKKEVIRRGRRKKTKPSTVAIQSSNVRVLDNVERMQQDTDTVKEQTRPPTPPGL